MQATEAVNRQFILLAGLAGDVAFTGLVADLLGRRFSCQTQILRTEQLSRTQVFNAMVTLASAEQLQGLFDALDLESIKKTNTHLVLIHPSPDAAHYALALRRGFADVIAWPHDLDRWCDSCQLLFGACSKNPQKICKKEEFSANAREMQLLGNSDCMEKLRTRIAKIAAFDSNVLLVGETGSGKECVAQAIHTFSKRSHKPMVSLNCAALPEHLIESELFGYEKGAFTGAQSSHPGKFGLAEGGTLFLDEIGEMPKAAQAKILRVIESREYYRLGGSKPLQSNVRLIAATHRDLESLCARDEFRLDLYFRLNVARLDLPPLRQRINDILPLADHFVRESCKGMGRKLMAISAEARTALSGYEWPGNVRELRNAIEIAIINSETDSIQLDDLPAHLLRWAEQQAPQADERSLLVTTLQEVQWNKSEAARALNWSRMKLYRKLHQYGLALDASAVSE